MLKLCQTCLSCITEFSAASPLHTASSFGHHAGRSPWHTLQGPCHSPTMTCSPCEAVAAVCISATTGSTRKTLLSSSTPVHLLAGGLAAHVRPCTQHPAVGREGTWSKTKPANSLAPARAFSPTAPALAGCSLSSVLCSPGHWYLWSC